MIGDEEPKSVDQEPASSQDESARPGREDALPPTRREGIVPARRDGVVRRLAGVPALRVMTVLLGLGALSYGALRLHVINFNDESDGATQVPYDDVKSGRDEDATRFTMNGRKIKFSHRVDRRPVAEVAKEAESHCEGRVETSMGEDGESLVRCVTEDVKNANKAAVAAGNSSQNAGQAALGSLRLQVEQALTQAAANQTYSMRLPDGKTRVLTLDTKTVMDLRTMFPENGDAPGMDSKVLPRPSSSVRLFSAVIDDIGSTIRVYRSELSESAAESEMAAEIVKRGWQEVPDETKGTRAFLSGAHGALVRILHKDGDGRGSLVSVIELGTERQRSQ